MELSPGYNFCLISFDRKISLMHFGRYLRLIKNYSETIIDEKIEENKDDKLMFSYQIGGKQLMKGQIIF
jgi:hypothetical protein